MDQTTPIHLARRRDRAHPGGQAKAWVAALVLLPLAVGGGALAGLKAGEAGWPLPAWFPASVSGLLVGRDAEVGGDLEGVAGPGRRTVDRGADRRLQQAVVGGVGAGARRAEDGRDGAVEPIGLGEHGVRRQRTTGQLRELGLAAQRGQRRTQFVRHLVGEAALLLESGVRIFEVQSTESLLEKATGHAQET